MGRSTAEGKRYRLGAWEKLEGSLPKERDIRPAGRSAQAKERRLRLTGLQRTGRPAAAGGGGCTSQRGVTGPQFHLHESEGL